LTKSKSYYSNETLFAGVYSLRNVNYFIYKDEQIAY